MDHVDVNGCLHQIVRERQPGVGLDMFGVPIAMAELATFQESGGPLISAIKGILLEQPGHGPSWALPPGCPQGRMATGRV